MLYGKEKFYGCEKPALIGKIKKFFFNKACMCGFFFKIVILLKLNSLVWILILIESHIKNKGGNL